VSFGIGGIPYGFGYGYGGYGGGYWSYPRPVPVHGAAPGFYAFFAYPIDLLEEGSVVALLPPFSGG